MADVAFERKRTLSREDAARWLSALAEGFAQGGEMTLPVGAGGVVTLRIPDEVRAEFEVEITGDRVEIEVELNWSLTGRADDTGGDGVTGPASAP